MCVHPEVTVGQSWEAAQVHGRRMKSWGLLLPSSLPSDSKGAVIFVCFFSLVILRFIWTKSNTQVNYTWRFGSESEVTSPSHVSSKERASEAGTGAGEDPVLLYFTTGREPERLPPQMEAWLSRPAGLLIPTQSCPCTVHTSAP